MGDGSFQQRTIFELVSENRFEEVQIGNRFGIFQNTVNYKQTPEGCLNRSLRLCVSLCAFAWKISFTQRRKEARAATGPPL
jgi:hypothetical protein